MARRSGDVWYVAAIADWDGATFELPLSFLGDGDCEVEVFADAADADKAPRGFLHTYRTVGNDEKLLIKLAPGGGWAASFRRK